MGSTRKHHEADLQATQGRKVQGKRLDLQDSLGGALEEKTGN